MPTPTVVDLSHHNTVTDFKRLKLSGVQGVIHKATEGASFVDKVYGRRRNEAVQAGLLWGAYHFFKPGNVQAQVDHFLNVALSDNLVISGQDILLCLDHEDKACTINDVVTFLQLIEKRTGRKAVLYSGHVLKEQLGSSVHTYLASHRLWLAQYGPTPVSPPAFAKGPWLWQYTDKGEVPGVVAPTDLNHSFALDLAGEWSGRVPPQGAQVPSPPVGSQPPVAKPKIVNVEAFGGLMGDTFSAGLKTIVFNAKTMYPKNVDQQFSEYHPYTQAQYVLPKMARWKDPINVVAHSFGLGEVLRVARETPNLQIKYLLGVDHSQYHAGPDYVPDNILSVDNFWQTTWWPFAIKGTPLFRADGSEYNIRNHRLYVPHAAMEDQKIVHDTFDRNLRKEIGL